MPREPTLRAPLDCGPEQVTALVEFPKLLEGDGSSHRKRNVLGPALRSGGLTGQTLGRLGSHLRPSFSDVEIDREQAVIHVTKRIDPGSIERGNVCQPAPDQ